MSPHSRKPDPGTLRNAMAAGPRLRRSGPFRSACDADPVTLPNSKRRMNAPARNNASPPRVHRAYPNKGTGSVYSRCLYPFAERLIAVEVGHDALPTLDCVSHLGRTL